MSPERRDRNPVRRMEAAVTRLSAFRARYGEPQLPTVGWDERLAFVEIESRVATALPWVPAHIREFIADYPNLELLPRKIPVGPYLYMSIFPNNQEGWEQRARVVLASYYGTPATEAEIAEAFSLKSPTSVETIIRLYLTRFGSIKIDKKYVDPNSHPLSRRTIRKLPQPETFSPQAGIETVKIHNDIWVYHERHCLPEVEEISQKLAWGDFVILDGPFGTGKTFNITNQLSRLRQAEGYTVENADGQSDSPQVIENEVLPQLLQQSRRLLIIDEFSSMLEQDEERALKLLQRVHDQNVEVLLVNVGLTQELRSSIAHWMTRKGAEMGINFSTHHLQTTHISPDLAGQYLRNINQADRALVDFVLDPANRALLTVSVFEDITSKCRTLDELREKLKESETKYRIEHGLTELRLKHGLVPIFLIRGHGGSKEDLIRVLTNIGLLNQSYAKWIDSIPDYN